MKTKAPTAPQERKSAYFTAFRCPPDLRAHLEEIAKREHRTLSNAIVALLYSSTVVRHA